MKIWTFCNNSYGQLLQNNNYYLIPTLMFFKINNKDLQH